MSQLGAGKVSWIALLVVLVVVGLAAAASAEVVQRGDVRVAFDGRISPQRLPRDGVAPVKVAVDTKISSLRGGEPPQLRKISIAINRHGRLDSTGLPICEVDDIQPATTAKALEACRGSLVGEGSFSAEVALSAQVDFPSEGKMLAFNGTYKGKPAILAHVYGDDPIPTSFTLPFIVTKSKGTFGSTLTATIPASSNSSITSMELNLNRRFSYHGKARSYASAGCPAPKGFPGATFPFARATYDFKGGRQLSQTLTRSCKARG